MVGVSITRVVSQFQAPADVRRNEPRVPLQFHHADPLALEVVEGNLLVVLDGEECKPEGSPPHASLKVTPAQSFFEVLRPCV